MDQEAQESNDGSTIRAASCKPREDREPQEPVENSDICSECGDLSFLPQLLRVPFNLQTISLQEARRRHYRASGWDKEGRFHEGNIPRNLVILPDRVFYGEKRTTREEKAYVIEHAPKNGEASGAGQVSGGAPSTPATAPARNFAFRADVEAFQPRTRENSESPNEGSTSTTSPTQPLGALGALEPPGISAPAIAESSSEIQEPSPPFSFSILNPDDSVSSFEEQSWQIVDLASPCLATEQFLPDPDFAITEKAFAEKVQKWQDIEDKGKRMGQEIIALKKRNQSQDNDLFKLRNKYEVLMEECESLKEENEKVLKELKSYEEHESLKEEHDKMLGERKLCEELESLKEKFKKVSEELLRRRELEAAGFNRLTDFQRSLHMRTSLTDVEKRILSLTAQQLQRGWGLERLVNHHRTTKYYSTKIQEDESTIKKLDSKVMRLGVKVERLLDDRFLDALEDIEHLFDEVPPLKKFLAKTASPVSAQTAAIHGQARKRPRHKKWKSGAQK